MNLNSWWRYVPMLLKTPKFRRRRSSRAVGCDVTSFLSFLVPHVTWHDNRFVKISWNRNPCFSRLRPTELTVYYRIWTLHVFSKILWAVRVSESVSREGYTEIIHVVEIAAGCPAGSAQRMKAEEERKSAEWRTMKRPWSYLILKMKR